MMAAMRRASRWRRSASGWRWGLAVAVVGAVAVTIVVTLALDRNDQGLQRLSRLGSITGLAAMAVGVVMWAWRTTSTARERRLAATVPSGEVLAHAMDVLAGRVQEQWQHEARLRSLDDPDPIPVRWHSPTPGSATAAVMDHPTNIQTVNPPAHPPGFAGERGVWWAGSSADIAALAAGSAVPGGAVWSSWAAPGVGRPRWRCSCCGTCWPPATSTPANRYRCRCRWPAGTPPSICGYTSGWLSNSSATTRRWIRPSSVPTWWGR
jgi:hypothetical protein